MRLHLLFGSLFILAASQAGAVVPTNNTSGLVKVAVDPSGQKGVNERIVLVSTEGRPVRPPRPDEIPPLPPLPDVSDVPPFTQAPKAPAESRAVTGFDPNRPPQKPLPLDPKSKAGMQVSAGNLEEAKKQSKVRDRRAVKLDKARVGAVIAAQQASAARGEQRRGENPLNDPVFGKIEDRIKKRDE